MLLAVDVGNTNIVFAVFEDGEIRGKWRLSTDAKRTADEYAVLLKELFALEKLKFTDITDIIASSVVPQSHYALKTLYKQYFRRKPLVVGRDGVKLGLKVKTDTPSEVGADRLVNAVAAYRKHKKPCIILDFGTATTFDAVDGKGDYLGGLIAPGINLSLDALHRAAAKLPEIGVEKPKQVIGKSTVSAMQAGIYYGYLGLIEGIITRLKKQLGGTAVTVATGGLAPLFAKATDAIDDADEDLTLNGLNEIYKLNA